MAVIEIIFVQVVICYAVAELKLLVCLGLVAEDAGHELALFVEVAQEKHIAV